MDYAYIWGDTLDELDRMSVDARIVNLETSVTVSRDAAPKGIHYKINPLNIGALTAAKIDGCVLANNHVLDWGRSGLLETLETLRRAKILTVGAGLNADEAMSPAALELADSVRLLLFGFGLPSSGIPADWAATDTRPGINLLPDCSNRTLSRIAEQTRALARAGDVLVASLHWGANWGYDVPREQREFAHGLIESAGFTIIHGHSSHHPKAIEIHRGRPILYGCGDFITDYEGISGHEVYRSDLALMYLPRFELPDGVLVELRMIPFRTRKFRLERAERKDAAWLQAILDRESRKFGTRVALEGDESLTVRW